MQYSAAIDDVPLIEQDENARAALIRRYPQYQDTIESMHRYGCAIIDPKYYLYDLDEARWFCENIAAGKSGMRDAWMSNRAVQNIATHASVIRLLSSLYGRRAFPFQTINFDRGTEQRTYADTYRIDTKPHGFICGVWVALEDVDENAGPLFYYPESHKLPHIERGDLVGKRSYADYERHISALVDGRGFNRTQALLKKGQALIWTANLAHGESPRLNPALTRFSQETHYSFEGCAYYSPMRYKEEEGKEFVLEPFDIARRRFVKSNQELLAGRPELIHRLAPQWAIWKATLLRKMAIE